MGIYVVTGGTKGIGGEAAAALRKRGHEVINIDIDRGDIGVNLGTKEGREAAVLEVHKRCPGGIDGLIANAGIAGAESVRASKVLSVNYFGTVAICEGLYGLLKMKRGSCVVTVSGTVAYSERGKYSIDRLLTDCGDEERINRLADSFEPEAGNTMYINTKIALVRWMKRTAPSWAAKGVNLNAVAPGAVATTIMDGLKRGPDAFLRALPLPMLYKENKIMDAGEPGNALALMVLPEARGICGALVYCDAGTAALLFSERYR